MIFRRALAAAAFVLIGLGASAQEPILRFSVDPSAIVVPAGGTATVTVRVENESLREADDVEVTLVGSGPLSIEPAPPIRVVPPFEAARWDLALAADAGAAPGALEARLEFVYTYCVGDLCFQIFDAYPLEVRIDAPAADGPPREDTAGGAETSPIPEQRAPAASPWRWGAAAAAGVALVIVLVGRVAGGRAAARAMIGVLVLGGLAVGVARRQHEQAQAIGSVLCTSCVGIEEPSRAAPELSSGAIDALARLAEPRELVVFYAPWCHSCPYAEAMVEAAAARSESIRYRFVNVEEDPEAAREAGIVESGRTIVPAILRVDTGDVLFGIDHLERRLLELIGVSP